MSATGPEPARSGSGPSLYRPPGGNDVLGDNFDLDWLKKPEVVVALDQWSQGDIVSGLRTFWAVSEHGKDPLSGAQLDPQPDGGWVTARESLVTEDRIITHDQLGVIVSQTCDVVASGPGARHPTVQVAPIVNLANFPSTRAGDVRAGSTVDMVVVTSMQPPGEWAADLRISLPVSKAMLVEQQPVRGFLNEQDSLDFSDRVAIKLRRPALHDYVAVDMIDSLNKLIRQERAHKAAWMDRVEQIRVRATAPALTSSDRADRHHPRRAALAGRGRPAPPVAHRARQGLRQSHRRRKTPPTTHPPARQGQRPGLQRVCPTPPRRAAATALLVGPGVEA